MAELAQRKINEVVLTKNLVKLTGKFGWITAHSMMVNRYSISYANLLWDKALMKGYVYRAEDGRILLTEKGYEL
jgi:hypothetical protein